MYAAGAFHPALPLGVPQLRDDHWLLVVATPSQLDISGVIFNATFNRAAGIIQVCLTPECGTCARSSDEGDTQTDGCRSVQTQF